MVAAQTSKIPRHLGMQRRDKRHRKPKGDRECILQRLTTVQDNDRGPYLDANEPHATERASVSTPILIGFNSGEEPRKYSEWGPPGANPGRQNYEHGICLLHVRLKGEQAIMVRVFIIMRSDGQSSV